MLLEIIIDGINIIHYDIEKNNEDFKLILKFTESFLNEK